MEIRIEFGHRMLPLADDDPVRYSLPENWQYDRMKIILLSNDGIQEIPGTADVLGENHRTVLVFVPRQPITVDDPTTWLDVTILGRATSICGVELLTDPIDEGQVDVTGGLEDPARVYFADCGSREDNGKWRGLKRYLWWWW